MSRPTVPTCDECGAQKKETNHWWTAAHFATEDGGPGLLELSEYWPEAREPQKDDSEPDLVLDLCSEQCVTRAIGKWMRGELK